MFNLLWIVEMGQTFAPSLFPDSTVRPPDGHPFGLSLRALPSQGAPKAQKWLAERRPVSQLCAAKPAALNGRNYGLV